MRLAGRLSIELLLADAADACVAGSSASYEVQEMSIRCAVSKLDNALESSSAQMRMSNGPINLSLNTYTTQATVLPAGNIEMFISLTRVYSRLNALFISFQGPDAADTPPANKQHTISHLNPS